MIVSVISTKGGVGKSTLTANLAVFLTAKNKKVLVIDTDAQQSLIKWNYFRQLVRQSEPDLPEISVLNLSGTDAVKKGKAESAKGTFVLIDTAGIDSETMRDLLPVTDFVLTISSPSKIDIWEISRLIDLCQKVAKIVKRPVPVHLVLNRCPSNKKVKVVEDAKEFLSANPPGPDYIFQSVIKDRIAFLYAFSNGVSVSEYEPTGKAAKEFEAFTSELLKQIKKV